MILSHASRSAALRFSHWQHRVPLGRRLPRSANTVLITVWNELAQTQMYPLHFYRRRLQRDHGIHFCELRTDDFLRSPERYTGGSPATTIDHVFVQPPLEVDAHLAQQLLDKVRTSFPKARVYYMDWFAPADARLASTVNPYIDKYVKKQLLRDVQQLEAPMIGDSNLTDYYNQRLGVHQPVVTYPIPPGFQEKLVRGTNFAFSPQMVDLFLGPPPDLGKPRSIDIHARLATKGVPWYQYMREEAQRAIHAVKGRTIVSQGRVKRHKFFAELRDSKLCFSPFGYGEVCWRDYEAYATGSLLLKPSMEHLHTHPSSFVPGKTYVPLAWDLSDLEHKVEESLGDTDMRVAICREAFRLHHEYVAADTPLQDVQAILQ